MSDSDITQYVVTFRFQEKGLSDVLELNSTLTNAGFTTTLHGKDGHAVELGTNRFGIVSALDEAHVREQAEGLGEMALGEKPGVEIDRFDAFLAAGKS